MNSSIHRLSAFVAVALLAFSVFPSHGRAQEPSRKPFALRGKISALDKRSLTVKTAAGEVMVRLTDGTKIGGVEAAKTSDISPGSYIGATAVKQPDGSLKALEVHIFPESSRGVGEGHYPWDLAPGSTMTNGSVEAVQARTVGDVQGQQLTVKYKNGEQKILVPPGVPVVKNVPGDRSLLKPGTGVYISAVRSEDGTLSANYIVAGIGRIMPPM